MGRNPHGTIIASAKIMYLKVELEIAKEKLEAIQALIDGEWDNEQLNKIGYLRTSFEENVRAILNY